ncbi:MAG: hypothetical protein NVS4B7_13100 [Ktedonobacteraceae bacterium]
MLPTICILFAIIAGLWHAPTLLTDLSQLITTHHSKQGQSSAALIDGTLPLPAEYQLATTITAQHYMHALLNHQYTSMWQMLHPQVQALWPAEAAFVTYWQTRFQHYTLQHFTLGKVYRLAHWVNPETMIDYPQALEVPVSLTLEPDQTIQQDPLAPPEDLHPDSVFQNLPFIVQRVPGQHGGAVSWLVLNGGPADLEAPILPPIQPPSTTVKVPILMYHHISDVVPQSLLGLSLTVTPTMFGQQLDYLKQQGYATITFNQLFDALYYGGPLPQHPIILSFDDGYDDVYKFAYPMLKAHGFGGMFYIITGKIGWVSYLNWHQIKTMFANGMQIGSHTIHHVDMGQLVTYSEALAQHELQKSQAVLTQHLGISIQQFCYPSGEPFRSGSWEARQQIVKLLAADGYVGATTDPGLSGSYQSSLAPFALLRIRVDGRSTLQFFKNSLLW